MHEVTLTQPSLPTKPHPWENERAETVAFYRDHFLDVSRAYTGITLNPFFESNTALLQQIPGWPNPNPNIFCLFSVPEKIAEPRQLELKRHPIVEKLRKLFGARIISRRTADIPPTIEASNHWGMGRGISALKLPLRESNLAKDLKAETQKKSKPGLIGVFDPITGFFYTNLGLKGNGATANEIRKTALDPELAAKKRREGDEAWGIVWEPTSLEIEEPTLEQLAVIGFRVGRVIGTATLDRKKLTAMIDPYYQEAELGEQYNIKSELDKGNPSWKPAIILRLGGGVRADVMDRAEASLGLLEDGMYGLSSEMAKMGEVEGEQGSKLFQDKYKFPTSYAQIIQKLSEYDYSQGQAAEYLYAYFWILSFLMWRNYHMQDEYNRLYADPEHNNLGPLWLNYKPGDWDVGGYIFDVDIFNFKRDVATEVGEEQVRQNDALSLRMGLGFIANKIKIALPNLPIDYVIEQTYQDSLAVSQKEGFLKPDSRQEFYSS